MPEQLETSAAVLVATEEPLQLMRLKIPELRAGQVLVDIAYSGICHTQLLEIKGLRGPDAYLPHALGHEASGTVAAVGDSVTKVRPGDHVVLSWIRGQGCEVSSTTYGSEIGPVNSGAISTFMERTVVSENRVTQIGNELPLREAALLGCAIPTGVGAITNTANMSPGESVAVFGVGGVGLSAILGAVMVGSKTIIAVDVIGKKLEKAADVGATHLVDASRVDSVDEIKALTGGTGVDIAVEASGRATAMEAAFKSVRDDGGLCVVVGNPAAGETISLDPFDLIRGKRIIGSAGGGSDPDTDIPRYEQLVLAGKLNVGLLIDAEYTLDEIDEAFVDLGSGNLTRAVLRLS